MSPVLRRVMPWVAVLLTACGRPTTAIPVQDPAPFQPGAGGITGLELACATDGARWSLRVRTDAWAATGLLVWGTGPQAVEAHSFGSVQAEAGGGADCLRLNLGVEPDWTEAVASVSTRFRCADLPDLAATVLVSDAEATTWSDCRSFGDTAAAFSGREDVPGCSAPLDAGAAVAAEDTAGAVEVKLSEGTLADCP